MTTRNTQTISKWLLLVLLFHLQLPSINIDTHTHTYIHTYIYTYTQFNVAMNLHVTAGTLNSDEPRDLDLPLKDRFYLQPLSPAAAAARAKESAKDIVNLKELIDKKQWPYVQNDLRLKASYLRYDLNTIISAKPKEEKKPLKDLAGKLFATIGELDHAAKIKSVAEAEKYYGQTKSALSDVLAKLG